MANSYIKDPSAYKDYSVDWTLFLEEVSDTIASIAWTVPAGLTAGTTSATSYIATQWLSGGTVDTDYEVVCRMTSVGGRIDERTIIIKVRNQ